MCNTPAIYVAVKLQGAGRKRTKMNEEPIDLRGTQGPVVIPHGTVVQNYEASKTPSLDERLAFQAQQIAQLSDDVAQMKLQISTQDAQRLLFERALKDALAEAVTTIRGDLATLKTSAVRLPRSRTTVFIMAWVFLAASVPLFYSDMRSLIGFEWSGAMFIALTSYLCSAMLFAYLFGLFDNQVD